MQVTVEYAAQVKQAAGVGSETVELDEGSSVRDLILRVADRHGDPLRRVIARPWLRCAVRSAQGRAMRCRSSDESPRKQATRWPRSRSTAET